MDLQQRTGRLRPLMVEEALQYSPLSSIAPFSPETIPLPTPVISGSTSLVSNLGERAASRGAIDDLKAEARRTSGKSELVATAVSNVSSLLRSEALTEFKFKSIPGVTDKRQQPLKTNGTSNAHSTPQQTGSFADMVLRSSDVRYTRPTQVSTDLRSAQPQANSKVYRDPPASSTPEFKPPASTKQAHAADSKHVHQKDSVIKASGKPVPTVIVPPISAERSREYERFPDEDLRINESELSKTLARKRKREEMERDDNQISRRADQKEKSEISLRDLQDLVSNIFEAEDQLQPDTSGAVSVDASNYFMSAGFSDGNIPTLASSIQTKLEASIQKVISMGVFAHIPVDQLNRLQKLSEGALALIESTDLRVAEIQSDDDVDSWLQRVGLAENALKAARTVLRIMTGGREEKQLYSEEQLQNILNMLKTVFDTCLIPIVELRNSGPNGDMFKKLSAQRKAISTLLHHCGKVLRLLADLLIKVEVSEGAVTTVEFLASTLIFVENAPSEKESVLGIQKYETLRRTGMDVLGKIFARYPDQRTFIIDEILTSLEKLPVTRQNARHYKLVEGKNIQLVSALIMLLIQSCGTIFPDAKSQKKRAAAELANGEEQDPADLSEEEEDYVRDVSHKPGPPANDNETTAAQNPQVAIRDLTDLVRPLYENAHSIASYVIKYLVQRAQTSTKTGDQPYRHLLDIFTEDFVTVIDSADWPAAELLLRILLITTINIAESDKSTAPAKNMALDLMGLMGSTISDVMLFVRQLARNLENDESELSGYLVQLAEDSLSGKISGDELLLWEGVYRISVQYLDGRNIGDAVLQSACGYCITQWARGVWCSFEAMEDDESNDIDYGRLSYRIRKMAEDHNWLETEYAYQTLSTTQGRLAYAITVLNSVFCKSFDRVLSILLKSMTSDQATVRSRSLKSVVQLLDKDPTVLERGAYVMRQILACASDRSPLVRDSALSLISKCLNLKPALEYEALGTILHRTADLAVGVRKRAMKLLKDIYLRNTTKEVRSAIADSLFQRINDTEDSICDLARQMFEEIWISPFYHSAVQDHGSVSFKISLNDQTSLIVKTAQRGGNVLAVLESLLKNIMSQASKNAAANFEVCQAMVAGMFDSIVDNEDAPEKPKQQHVLQTLTVFAKANPKLFTTTQLELLQPYVENLSKFDDLLIYRSVIIIFRFVFPCLPRLQAGFCKMVQDALMRSVSKLGKPELNEAVPCLWTINGVLGNIDRLIRLTISSLQQVYSARNINLADDSQAKTALRVKRYMMITGMFGKYCDFEHEPRLFKESFPWWKGNSVSGLMVDILSLFTASAHPLEVRKQALDSVCNICQFWPKNFLKEQVNSAFDKVFAEGKQDLEDIVLKGFAGFFALEEKRSEKGLEDSADDINKEEAGRLSGALIANENDGISASIAQRYVKPILRIALATQDDYALTAVEVIASINRQGLVHPKECGPTFVSLETSTNARIADIAVAEHRALHGKHESMLEKEYMKAVYQAFMYQKDVVGDSSGTTHHPFHSKLRSFFEVIKTGNGKLRKKFLSSLCARADFDLAKLDVTDPLPEHLLYVRFVADNLAFFEYGRLDELLHLVSCLENVVAGTGTGVAHAIETEVFSVKLDETAKIEPQEESITLVRTTQTPSADRLRQLATASMILSILWETRTFLRRLYGLSAVQKQRDVKGKAAAKDLTRSPTKAPGIHGDRFIDEMLIIMRGLSSPETMMAQCQKFVELLSVDNDFKLAADGENGVDEAARLETPSEDEDEAASVPPSGGSRGGKRKGSHPVDGMVSKVKKSRPSLGGRMRRSSTDVGDADQNADPNWI